MSQCTTKSATLRPLSKNIFNMQRKNQLRFNPNEGTIDRILINGTIRLNVGSYKGRGYMHLKIDGVNKASHIAMWEHVNGSIPSGYEIDHINGNRSDNRITNLRLVTHKENMENRHKPRVDNISGLKGVQWKERDKKFHAVIGHNGKKISLGYHLTAEKAHAAYIEAAGKFHTHNPSITK